MMHSSFYIKRILVLCFLSSSLNTRAQLEERHLIVEQRPWFIIFEAPYGQFVTSKIKKVTSVTVLDEQRKIKHDTTYVCYYSQAGKLDSSVRFFQKNVNPPLTTHYFYKDSLISQLQHEQPWGKQLKQTIQFNQYNEFGKRTEAREIGFMDQDTNGIITYRFEYDDKARFVKKSVRKGWKSLPEIEDEYTYENGLLTRREHVSRNDHDPKPHISQTLYHYNRQGLPTIKIISNIIDTINPRPLFEYHYIYDSLNRMTRETSVNYQLEDGSSEASYFYNEENQLTSMKATRKEKFINVTYNYENRKIKHIRTESNYSAFSQFTTPILFPDNIKHPVNYEELFTYDEHGNLTERRYILEDQPLRIIAYRIEYY